MQVDISPAIAAGSWHAWRVAIRPNSLLIAVGPVLAGASIGYARTGAIDWTVLSLAIAAAVLMQLITNLQNDVGYTERGDEFIGDRVGLPRATAQGWLTMPEVHFAIKVLAVLAAGLGVALVAYRGWLVLAIGTASLVAAFGYMGGNRPIAYTPLGEFVAFVFFGPVAVMGTDWLLTGSTSTLSALAGCCAGSLTAAALAVNNHRDRDHDRAVGRRTFAVVWGLGASKRLLQVLVLGPFLIVISMAFVGHALPMVLPVLLVWPAIKLLRDFNRCTPGVAYNAILFRTFALTLWFALLMSMGVLLSRQLA